MAQLKNIEKPSIRDKNHYNLIGYLRNESGRSMVEMLGTLAIMGIVALAGMWAYNAGMDQLKANTLINEAQKRAVIVAGQINMLNRTDPSLGEFSDNTFGGGTFGTNVTVNGLYQQFGIQVSNVPKRVCQNILNAVGDSIAIRRLSIIGNPTESMTTCGENNSFLMIYNNDLSTSRDTEYAESTCGCQTVCGTCITENDVARCVNECPATGTCSATQPCSGDCVGCVIPEGETTGTCQTCQPVEYLESSGTQYINTGIFPSDDFKAELEWYTTSTGSAYACGSRHASNSPIYFAFGGSATGATVSGVVNSTNSTAKTENKNWQRMTSGQQYAASITINGDGTFTYAIQDKTNNRSFNETKSYTPMGNVTTPIYLFAYKPSNVISHMRLYTAKMHQNGVSVLDLVPIHAPFQPTDKQNCMYDKVTKALFCNAANGDDFTIP